MATVAELLSHATTQLVSVSETPRLDAEYLLAHALGLSRAQLLARLYTTAAPCEFDALLARRMAYEPIPYILGEWEFFSVPLTCRPPTLVPRPETEHLVEAVLEEIGDSAARVLELCTGTGCVAIALALNAPRTMVWATDIAPEAVALARENVERHRLQDRVTIMQSDLFDALSPAAAPFDVVCVNPPYVEADAWPSLSPSITRYEDPIAVVSGPDGLDLIRRIVGDMPQWLRPGGLIVIEIGEAQESAVRALLEQRKCTSVEVRRDLAGHPRIACGFMPE